jgi:N-acyl-D-amino-acid deacylase
LKDRGVLEKGKAADVVVFDPKTVTDKASYDAPKLYAEGITHILVNGKVAVAQGQVTGELSGRPLP